MLALMLSIAICVNSLLYKLVMFCEWLSCDVSARFLFCFDSFCSCVLVVVHDVVHRIMLLNMKVTRKLNKWK